jgi:hypothetical protein
MASRDYIFPFYFLFFTFIFYSLFFVFCLFHFYYLISSFHISSLSLFSSHFYFLFFILLLSCCVFSGVIYVPFILPFAFRCYFI